MTQKTLVLGGGPTGLEIATELAGQDQPVAFVDAEPTATRAREAGLTAHESTLQTARPSVDCSAGTVIVATQSDARNLLLATVAPRAFDADRVVALVNDPDRRVAFDDAGIETVCVSRSVARATTDAIAVADPTAVEDTTSVEESTPADRTTETDERVRLRE
jgi:trk system potassium uptake protein TrkA